jgi:hypothetical protein
LSFILSGRVINVALRLGLTLFNGIKTYRAL